MRGKKVKNRKFRRLVGIMSMTLAAALVAGVLVGSGNVESNASQKSMSNTGLTVLQNTIAQSSDETGNDYLIEIRSKYNTNNEVKFTSLEELYSSMEGIESEEEREEMLAYASDEVVMAYFFNEINTGLQDADGLMENINKNSEDIYNIAENVSPNIETNLEVNNERNGFSVSLSSQNDYGTNVKCQVIDETDEVVTKDGYWCKPKVFKPNYATKKYGNRKYTAKWEVEMLGKTYRLAMVMRYKLSKSGMKATTLSQEGTLCTVPFSQVECDELEWIGSKTAKKVGKSINAQGLYKHIHTGIGASGKIFGIDFSKITAAKIEGKVKIISWDKKKKTMKLEQSRNYYYWKEYPVTQW